MGRVENAARNIFYGYIGNILIVLLGFVSRTVFIRILGVTYLGINGLFENLLTVLSLAELGIGIAMNFSLFKPVADRDTEKIKALMSLYKRMYRVIALIITLFGLALIPFLEFIIKDPGGIALNAIRGYFLVYLADTVITYFVSYKYSIVLAEQKGYILTNINSITVIIRFVLRIIVLFVFRSYSAFLIITLITGAVQMVFVNRYINRMYPYLKDKNITSLPAGETKAIRKNIVALFYHKIGEVSVHQTDSIIISSFINVTTVGLVSNYNLLVFTVRGFINIIFNALIPGFGNLIATESEKKQFEMFKVYRFLGFWVFGFSSVAFIFITQPFIELWLGKKMLIESAVLYLIVLNFYMAGQRTVLSNFKIAAGIFDADKFISIFHAISNLIISIPLAMIIGLKGVILGSVISGLVSSFTRPYIVYKRKFSIGVFDYYEDAIKYILVVCASCSAVALIVNRLYFENGVVNILFIALVVAVVPNAIFYLFFRNRAEFKYLVDIVKARLRK